MLYIMSLVLIYLIAGSLCLLTAFIQSILFLSMNNPNTKLKKFHSLRNKFKTKISKRLILKLKA